MKHISETHVGPNPKLWYMIEQCYGMIVHSHKKIHAAGFENSEVKV